MEHLMRHNSMTRTITGEHLYVLENYEKKVRKVMLSDGEISIVLSNGEVKQLDGKEKVVDWAIQKNITQLVVDGKIDINTYKNVKTMGQISYAIIRSDNVSYQFISQLPPLKKLWVNTVPNGDYKSVDWSQLEWLNIKQMNGNMEAFLAMTSLEKFTIGEIGMGACGVDGKLDMQLPGTLKKLQIGECACTNLDFIRNNKLVELTICNSALENLDALETQADTLEVLVLRDYITKDLSAIGKLKNLHCLEIGQYEPENMDFLEQLENLEVLSISGTRYDESVLDILDKLPNIKAVYVPRFWVSKLENKHKYKVFSSHISDLFFYEASGYTEMCDEWEADAEAGIFLAR